MKCIAMSMLIYLYLYFSNSICSYYPNILVVIFGDASYKISFQSVALIQIVNRIKTCVEYSKPFSSSHPQKISAVYVDVILYCILDELWVLIVVAYIFYFMILCIYDVNTITGCHIYGVFFVKKYVHDMRIDKTGILWSKCVKISCFRIKYMQATFQVP